MPEKYVLQGGRGQGEGEVELVLEFGSVGEEWEGVVWNFACAKLLRSFKEECFMG